MEDIANITFEDVGNTITDFFGEDRVEVSTFLSGYIIIHFPHVTVVNEYDQSIDITHLFVRVKVDTNGAYKDFGMLRTEFTKAQLLTRYIHSHCPRLNVDIDFHHPCLGEGPLRTTVCMLATDPSVELWTLFCLELSKYVETESLQGGPYISLREVTRTYTHSYTLRSTATITTITDEELYDFVNFVINRKVLNFNFDSYYGIALSYDSMIITLSNLFIEWCNSLPEAVYEERKDKLKLALTTGIYQHGLIVMADQHSRQSTEQFYSLIGTKVLTFKGQDYNFTVIENKDEEESTLQILTPIVLNKIINILIKRVNYEYGVRAPISYRENLPIRYL